jgi:hypothetical protein
MELVEIFRTLGRHKRALGGVIAFAVLIALMTAYSIGPSGIHKRGSTYGTAQAQVLVDSPQSALANLKQDTIPLSTRAGVFAQFMASSAVREEIAKATGIPAAEIVARGPFDDPAVAPAGTQVPAAPKPPSESSSVSARPYQLTFVAQEELPLVTVYAQAPTAAGAKKLADGVSVGVKAHISHMQDVGQLDEKDRVVIRGLGPAQAGTVNGGSALPMMLLAFVFIVLAGSGVILAVARFKDRDDEYELEDELDPEDEPVAGDLQELLTQVERDEAKTGNGNGNGKPHKPPTPVRDESGDTPKPRAHAR